MTGSFGPFRSGHQTHPGPRDTNQDTVLSIALPRDRWLLAVADGMGGLEEGELASKTALGALYSSLSGEIGLPEAVQEANSAVNRLAQNRVMGTTLVAAVISGRQVEIVNVGDSRAYQSDILGLIQVTRDHTLATQAESDGSLPLVGIDGNSGRWAHALARYLGEGPDVEVDQFGPLDLVEGGWLLLCSDGLHNVMSAEEMDGLLENVEDAQKAASELVEEALRRGTEDNVSVALLHWPDSASRMEPESPVLPSTTGTVPAGRKARSEPQGRILIRSPRDQPPSKTLGLTFKVFIIVVPLVIVMVFLIDWILSL